ncbi:MAG: cytidine deaminase [Prevotella histicola]|jgi:cytidine deaminase|uniref:cytidine deaminase n=1 Tax=Prevotella histicola TaxID=470565 RepID=UPI001CB142F6|nr:cytidine deaminase [Prevotella histicola]MBF1402863.1 cytidine deaminase [Prevotella histicola]MBF1411340.1 cytidine deaminase [Prevotella histicola]
MKTIDLSIKIGFGTFDELSADDQHLIQTAIAATENSYSPYSHFQVGAALRLANGKEVMGANQENAAFPSGLCAERSAIFAAQSNYPDQPVTALAIAARNEHGLMHDPIVPCGACRQVILEIEDRYKQPIRILLYGTGGVYVINTVKELLPLQFVSESMK